MELQDKLVLYGLSEREAQVYLSSMELGPSSVQRIAKHAKINRVSAYNFIEKLIDKGLISTFQEGKKNMYVASEPESILNLFKQKKKEIEELEEDFKKDLPEFNSKYNVAQGKPKVRYYEGLDGVVALNKITIEENSEPISTLYDLDEVKKYFSNELRETFKDIRVDKQVDIEVIYKSNTEQLKDTEHRTVYKIDKDSYELPADIAIFGNKVRFTSFSEKVSGIVIEDVQIAKSMKTLYDLAVEYLKKKKAEKSSDSSAK